LVQPKQDIGNLRKQFLDHQARWNEVMKRVMQHFLFTSNPLGGLVSHLMAKCGGNVHDKGVVEITASSLEFATRSKFTPRNAADFGTLSLFCQEDQPGQRIC
jgi:hypothetical protein